MFDWTVRRVTGTVAAAAAVCRALWPRGDELRWRRRWRGPATATADHRRGGERECTRVCLCACRLAYFCSGVCVVVVRCARARSQRRRRPMRSHRIRARASERVRPTRRRLNEYATKTAHESILYYYNIAHATLSVRHVCRFPGPPATATPTGDDQKCNFMFPIDELLKICLFHQYLHENGIIY